MLYGAGSMQLSCIRPSACLIQLPHAAAVGLLLWAQRPGNIDRLARGQSAAAAQQQMWGVPHCQLS